MDELGSHGAWLRDEQGDSWMENVQGTEEGRGHSSAEDRVQASRDGCATKALFLGAQRLSLCLTFPSCSPCPPDELWERFLFVSALSGLKEKLKLCA